MTNRFSGPQYLSANGLPIKQRPDSSHFGDTFKNIPLPQKCESKRQISPEAAKKIAKAIGILLNSKWNAEV